MLTLSKRFNGKPPTTLQEAVDKATREEARVMMESNSEEDIERRFRGHMWDPVAAVARTRRGAQRGSRAPMAARARRAPLLGPAQ
jgi:hypothetical protein